MVLKFILIGRVYLLRLGYRMLVNLWSSMEAIAVKASGEVFPKKIGFFKDFSTTR